MIYHIGIGSNIEDRLFYIKKALALLKETDGLVVKKASGVYETESEGGPLGQGDYYNLVIEVDSLLEPKDLLLALKKIERSVGRQERSCRWDEREIDLDILLCGNRRVNEEGLVIPHPRMHERAFVLKPLNDLDPGLRHPVLKKTVSWLFDQMNRKGRIRKVEEIVSVD